MYSIFTPGPVLLNAMLTNLQELKKDTQRFDSTVLGLFLLINHKQPEVEIPQSGYRKWMGSFVTFTENIKSKNSKQSLEMFREAQGKLDNS